MQERGKIFLIVDDEPDMCWALENLLRKSGFISKKAGNGAEAIALIGENSFQLALLDAKLPDIEGLELARHIVAIDPRVSIVMVSGYFYRDDASIQQAMAEGLISGFISKPFDHEEIVNVVESLCRQ